MNRKLLHSLIGISLGFFLLWFNPSAYGSNTKSATSTNGRSVELNGKHYIVEIADDTVSREQGLMYRTQLEDGHGMLFIFPAPQKLTFWMKNTLIPLDILFFDNQRQLINFHQRVPPCKSAPCPVYPSLDKAQYVLELNAGVAEKIGVKAGDELIIAK